MLRIDAARPGDRREVLGGDQLSGLAVENVEKPILVRLHQDLAIDAIDREVRQDQLLNRVVIPLLAGRGLVVPDIVAGVGIDRHDRRQEPIVALARAAIALIPFGPVTDTEINQIELGIIGDAFPNGAAATALPPLAMPGLGGFCENRLFHGLRGIAGHGVEAPGKLAGLGVVSRDIAAHPVFGAAVADHNAPFDDPRGLGNGVGLARIDRHDVPDRRSGPSVERYQSAVESADENLSLPRRHAAADDIAAAPHPERTGHRGIIRPEKRTSLGVVRFDHAPRSRDVQDAVDNERCRFLTAVGVELGVPGETELFRVVGRYPRQRTEPLLTVGPAISHPVGRILVGPGDAGGVHIGRRSLGIGRFGDTRKTENESHDRLTDQMLMRPSVLRCVARGRSADRGATGTWHDIHVAPHFCLSRERNYSTNTGEEKRRRTSVVARPGALQNLNQGLQRATIRPSRTTGVQWIGLAKFVIESFRPCCSRDERLMPQASLPASDATAGNDIVQNRKMARSEGRSDVLWRKFPRPIPSRR